MKLAKPSQRLATTSEVRAIPDWGEARRAWPNLDTLNGLALCMRGGVLKMLTSTRVLWMCDASAI
jgi:hypothetical protein